MLDQLTERFRAMAHLHRNAVRSELIKHGIYLGQHRILFLLQERPGLSQVEICEALKVTKESLSLSMKRLFHAGLVDCEKDECDKRKTLWSLTEAGIHKAKACKSGFQHVNEAMFGSLSVEEVLVLEGYFNKMIAGLERSRDNETVI